MKKHLSLILFFIMLTIPTFAEIYEGGVYEQGKSNSSRIIDNQTGKGIDNAQISIPQNNYSTKTDKNGFFELDTEINGTTIMSVKKDKYRPFSMTINEKSLNAPLVVSIEKSTGNELSIDANLHHLGDNSFSELSANASEFRSEATGPFYTKEFTLKKLDVKKPIYLIIGSIIGIDTAMSRKIGQNRIPNAVSSPPEVYFNGNKISEIQINGDGQKIKLPSSLIRKNQTNEITIKTGRNLMQTAYIDFDDIEFMNLIIEN